MNEHSWLQRAINCLNSRKSPPTDAGLKYDSYGNHSGLSVMNGVIVKHLTCGNIQFAFIALQQQISYNKENNKFRLVIYYEVIMMKKAPAILVTLALIVSLCACSSAKVNGKTTDISDTGVVTVSKASTTTQPPVSENSTTASTSSTTIKETVKVTIPEGYTFPQIAKKLEDSGVCDAKSFFEVAQTFKVQSFTIPSSDNRCYNLEGYLFPATYEFNKGDDPENVVRKMLNAYASNSGKPSDETLILASILEKEVRSENQMQMVASVLTNRIKAGKKLQCDATREYVNKNITDNAFLTSTERFAPLYNTYKCAGLPSGPICSPGKKAIEAAKNPAQSEYLYFFFGNDNQNHYSKTFEEHEELIKQYGVNFG